VIVKRYDIVAGYLEPAGDVGDEFIGIDIFWSVPCTPRLALSLVPNNACLGSDLPPAADINPVLPPSGDLEPAA